MSNEPQKSAPKSEPIAVRIARFTQDIEIPGKSFTKSITSQPENKERRASWWEVQYMPWLRLHKITWHEAGEGRPPRSVFVPEALVYWEPL